MKLLDLGSSNNPTSIQFANLECKNIWEDKISKASKTYPQMETLTVQHGLRKGLIAHNVRPESLGDLMPRMAKEGLVCVPISKESSTSNMHFSGNATGRDYGYRVAIARTVGDAESLVHAHTINDNIGIGRLLGYPHSSTVFFDEVWKKGYFDPIWQQAENSSPEHVVKRDSVTRGLSIPVNSIRLKLPDEAYMISSSFRYIGARILSHLPRSMDDADSISIAKEWVSLARELKVEGIEENLAILNLPYSWDCLKGVAIISTPVFKFSTASVSCYPKHLIQVENTRYPEEAPNGALFPWKIREREELQNDFRNEGSRKLM